MIIRQDGTFETNSLFPNINWYEGENNLIIDETTEEGQAMMATYINNYPLVTFTYNGNLVTSVTVIELERPPELNGKIIELIKNELNEWEYIYVDIPLTKEQELEQKINELQATLDALLGVN